jgi:hypothetical protein
VWSIYLYYFLLALAFFKKSFGLPRVLDVRVFLSNLANVFPSVSLQMTRFAHSDFRWAATFQIWVVSNGIERPYIFLKGFPLVLYVMWATCYETRLGRCLDLLREHGWSMERWFLELPLTFPFAIWNLGGGEYKACLVDICLGAVNPDAIMADLSDFFQCSVIFLFSLIYSNLSHRIILFNSKFLDRTQFYFVTY